MSDIENNAVSSTGLFRRQGDNFITIISDNQYLKNMKTKEKRLRKMVGYHEKELIALKAALSMVQSDIDRFEAELKEDKENQLWNTK